MEENSRDSDDVYFDDDESDTAIVVLGVEEDDSNNAISETLEHFDTDLPAAHNVRREILAYLRFNARLPFQYLGNMERVSGVQFLEPNKCYRLPIFFHDSIIFPGETLPMILTQQMFVSTEFSDDGLLFGLVFNGLRNDRNNDLYGVTCQIYEKGSDGINNVSIKSKAYQRFRIKNDK